MKTRSNFSIMSRLIKLVKPLTGFMVLAVTMGVIGNLSASFITVLGTFAVLKGLGYTVAIGTGMIFVLLVVFALVRGVLRYAEQACNHYIAFKLLAIIRDHVFQALRKLCPAKLEGKDRGDLISVITSDIELLEVFYAHTISPVLIATVFSTVMCLFIGSYSPSLALVALAAYITIGAVLPVITSGLSGDTGMKFRGQSGALSGFVLDSLRGLGEILQYGAGGIRLEQMNSRSDDLSRVEKRMKSITGHNMAVTNAVILVFDLIMLFYGSVLVQNGSLTFDGMIISFVALISSFGPVIALSNLGSTLQNTFAAGGRVLDILDEIPVVEEQTAGCDIVFDGAKAENVTFAYNDEEILSDFSVDISKDKITGIVGKSGSGKSTLLKLLMRFWDTYRGSIRISDEDIKNINTYSLRTAESYMTQQTYLFHDTVANNLRIAKQDATDEEIIAACKKASVHDFIMRLENGYETVVGELGSTLSGGERQRLGLAMAFLHDAPFMLLDEPTSNLDSLNEAIILKSLHQQKQGKTVVLVSHRQSTMKIADNIYNVEKGRLS